MPPSIKIKHLEKQLRNMGRYDPGLEIDGEVLERTRETLVDCPTR